MARIAAHVVLVRAALIAAFMAILPWLVHTTAEFFSPAGALLSLTTSPHPQDVTAGDDELMWLAAETANNLERKQKKIEQDHEIIMKPAGLPSFLRMWMICIVPLSFVAAALLAHEGVPTCEQRSTSQARLRLVRKQWGLRVLACCCGWLFISTQSSSPSPLSCWWLCFSILRAETLFDNKLHREYTSSNDDGDGGTGFSEGFEGATHDANSSANMNINTNNNAALHGLLFHNLYPASDSLQLDYIALIGKYWLPVLVPWVDLQEAPCFLFSTEEERNERKGRFEQHSDTTGCWKRTWQETACVIVAGVATVGAVVDACNTFRVTETFGTAENAFDALLFCCSHMTWLGRADEGQQLFASLSGDQHNNGGNSHQVQFDFYDPTTQKALSNAITALYLHAIATAIVLLGMSIALDAIVLDVALPLCLPHLLVSCGGNSVGIPRLVDTPHVSSSLAEFWGRRWHRGLSLLLKGKVWAIGKTTKSSSSSSSSLVTSTDRHREHSLWDDIVPISIQLLGRRILILVAHRVLSPITLAAMVHFIAFSTPRGVVNDCSAGILAGLFFVAQLVGLWLERSLFCNFVSAVSGRSTTTISRDPLLDFGGRVWTMFFLGLTFPLVSIPLTKRILLLW